MQGVPDDVLRTVANMINSELTCRENDGEQIFFQANSRTSGSKLLAPEEQTELTRSVQSELEYVTDALDSSSGYTPDHIKELRERQAVLKRLAEKIKD
jgi:hypothetical protein